MAATIKDVARQAGVAASTVSKYLNGGNVREENRTAIEAAVNKLNYRTDFRARILRNGRSGLVMAVVPVLSDYYCVETLVEMQRELAKRGYTVIVNETRFDAAAEADAVSRAIELRVEGVIGILIDARNVCYKELHSRGIPLVIMGEHVKALGASYVSFEDKEKCVRLIKELQKQGHERIGFIGSSLDNVRMSATNSIHYFRVMKSAKIDDTKGYVYSADELSVSAGISGAEQLMSLAEPPSAIFCANGRVMLGAFIYMQKNKISVPDDVALCGFLLSSEVKRPPFCDFTGICLPAGDAALRAVEMLVNLIANPYSELKLYSATLKVNCEIHYGKTTKSKKKEE